MIDWERDQIWSSNRVGSDLRTGRDYKRDLEEADLIGLFRKGNLWNCIWLWINFFYRNRDWYATFYQVQFIFWVIEIYFYQMGKAFKNTEEK